MCGCLIMDLFEQYFEYTGENETPLVFHRWSFISLIGSLIGRDIHLPFGHGSIYPNQYILLTGTPGARNGAAIKICKELLNSLNYQHTAPNKAVKESFWKWMANKNNFADIEGSTEMLDWDLITDDTVTEAYVAHDEFLDFVGVGDDSFITNLANLWDNLPSFTNPKTRGKDITIQKPTVNILSGITPVSIADTFKAIALGGGFFSRVLFIYSDPTDIKVTFPAPPNIEQGIELLTVLKEIQQLKGELILSPDVRNLIDIIYKSYPGMEDGRFQYYSQRRLTHLLKLIIVIAASRLSLDVTERDCILANTILYNAEISMPSALGEYGKGKNAEVSNTILAALNAPGVGGLNMKQIWKYVSRDLNKFIDLRDIMDGLVMADKVQKVTTEHHGITYLADNTINFKWKEGLVDLSMLQDKEHVQ